MEIISHFIVLRPSSALSPLFLDRAWTRTGLSHQQTPALPVLACLSLDTAGAFVQANVRWKDAPGMSSTQQLGIPHSEILLLIDARDNDPRTIGFLQEG